MTDKNFSYYTYEVGRESYKEDKSKLVWNVIDYDSNNREIRVVNLFEYNWVFLKDGLLYAKKHYANDYTKFASHVRNWLQHEYWSRCEYETVICSWPSGPLFQEDIDRYQAELDKDKKRIEENGWKIKPSTYIEYPKPSYKIDVYTQVMLNWDRFINYVWENKRLITKRKLGLETLCDK